MVWMAGGGKGLGWYVAPFTGMEWYGKVHRYRGRLKGGPVRLVV